jgi:hypothetical protein
MFVHYVLCKKNAAVLLTTILQWDWIDRWAGRALSVLVVLYVVVSSSCHFSFFVIHGTVRNVPPCMYSTAQVPATRYFHVSARALKKFQLCIYIVLEKNYNVVRELERVDKKKTIID